MERRTESLRAVGPRREPSHTGTQKRERKYRGYLHDYANRFLLSWSARPHLSIHYVGSPVGKSRARCGLSGAGT